MRGFAEKASGTALKKVTDLPDEEQEKTQIS